MLRSYGAGVRCAACGQVVPAVHAESVYDGLAGRGLCPTCQEKAERKARREARAARKAAREKKASAKAEKPAEDPVVEAGSLQG